MDAEHEFEDLDYVRRWTDSADERRPQRPLVFRHVADLIAGLGTARPRILELGCGPGALAYVLLLRLPQAEYIGLDYSPAMLELARERLAEFQARARLVRTDLREDAWTRMGAGFDAVVTNQALHDLGTAEAVALTYERVPPLVRPGGLFVNAELLPSDKPGKQEKPGKLLRERHLELLHTAGFSDVRIDLDYGEYVCFVARIE